MIVIYPAPGPKNNESLTFKCSSSCSVVVLVDVVLTEA